MTQHTSLPNGVEGRRESDHALWPRQAALDAAPTEGIARVRGYLQLWYLAQRRQGLDWRAIAWERFPVPSVAACSEAVAVYCLVR